MHDRDEGNQGRGSRRAALHGPARAVAIGATALGALGLAALVAWTAAARGDELRAGYLDPARPGQSFLGRGFWLVAHHPDYPLAAVACGALAAGAAALAIAMWRRWRWAYLGASAGAAIAAALPWLARAYVVHIETVSASRAWAARSRYVGAATSFALVATGFLALLAAAAITAFATAPRRAAPAPAGGAPGSSESPGARGSRASAEDNLVQR